jgi:hypothetical protein
MTRYIGELAVNTFQFWLNSDDGGKFPWKPIFVSLRESGRIRNPELDINPHNYVGDPRRTLK